MFKMVLPASLGIMGRMARVTRSSPSTLVCSMASQSSSRPAATVSSPCAPPALLMSTSTALVRLRAHCAKSSTLAVLVTSRLWHSAWGAPAWRAFKVVRYKDAAAQQAARTAAAPKPLEAPVIKTHLRASEKAITHHYPKPPRRATNKKRHPKRTLAQIPKMGILEA